MVFRKPFFGGKGVFRLALVSWFFAVLVTNVPRLHLMPWISVVF